MPESTAPTTPSRITTSPVILVRRSIELMKPVTWFAPSWAFLCGSIASGASQWTVPDVGRIALGTLLAGPILCGMSQVVNDYCDRDVDAINEPQRLIPSGLVSTRQVFITIGVLVVLGLSIASFLGQYVALMTAIGMVLAVIYSADPIRAKRNGWVGNALVAIGYEGLPWLAGHLAFAPLTFGSALMAALFSLGAHGIMTINDFKSMEGDRVSGIRSIPVLYGEIAAAWTAFVTINVAQILVVMYFLHVRNWIIAGIIGALVLMQIPTQWKFFSIADPRKRAIFYNASGIAMFVWGMMAAAIGVRG
ncbi:MAG: chlorophyll synthase ChlG [Roseiflexus sp.]|nr:chlorophyll synthase ChlG [Roseiflexus sp.]MCS7290999.1 chlorophyll synthase ChlG [Roseiflexus sp.]MDW8147461.1 chlorophyll synthase ChlG [Roseiflexaceae bacterium]MDW8232674.1 chlorophyll synthase ChlG [Roseiflexaceae bacterium]